MQASNCRPSDTGYAVCIDATKTREEHMKTIKFIRVFAWILIISMGLVLMQGVMAADTDRVLVIALDSDINTLDPAQRLGTVAEMVHKQIFDGLLERKSDMSVGPQLAKSWERIDDFTWVVRLQEGVKFHNGDDFTAEDVKFTIERLQDPEQNVPYASEVASIDSVTVLDEYTIEIHTSLPWPLFEEIFCMMRVFPSAYIRTVGDEEFGRNPVGTGPYMFEEWVRDSHVLLNAYPDYWRGAAEIGSVKFRVIPDQMTQVAELLSGGVDLILSVPAYQITRLEKDSGITTKATTINRVVFMKFSNSDPCTSDVRVREALALAINVDEIIATVLNGQAERNAAAVHPLAFGYDPDIPFRPYDPARALELLKEAGYPNGQGLKVELNATASRITSAREVVEAIVSYWVAIGVDVKLNFYAEVVQFMQLQREGKAGPIDFHSWGASAGYFDAHGSLYRTGHSKESWSLFYDPKIDALLEATASTTDFERRKALFAVLQEYMYEQVAWIPLYSELVTVAMRDVEWEPRVDERPIVYDMRWSD
jgi:peptide/nickel transport system substrate-binding protein